MHAAWRRAGERVTLGREGQLFDAYACVADGRLIGR